MEIGTVADRLSLARLTTAPPDGAARAKITVKTDALPPNTESGVTDIPASSGVSTVRVADALELPSVAVIFATVVDETPTVEALKVVEIAPA
jgi:hypothetical protein